MGTSWPRPSVGDYVMVTNGPMQNQEENALRYVRWGQLFADDGDQDLFGCLFLGGGVGLGWVCGKAKKK